MIDTIRSVADDRLRGALDAPERIRFQFLLSIADDASGPLAAFRPDAEYFYPASTVKLPTAAAVLESLGEPLPAALGVAATCAYRIGDGPARRVIDDVLCSISVSDNAAHNRLHDLLGLADVNARLARMGLSGTRITHRLDDPRPPEAHLRAPAVSVSGPRGVWLIPERRCQLSPPNSTVPGLLVGARHVIGGETRDGPMDFSGKNRLPLRDLHRFSLALATTTRADLDLRLNDDDRRLLLDAMGRFPRQIADPCIDPEWPDDFVKPMLPGLAARLDGISFTLRNKIGWAYGFLVDTAIISAPGRPALVLTTAMEVNSSGLVGADTYDYDTVGRPLLASLAAAAVGAAW